MLDPCTLTISVEADSGCRVADNPAWACRAESAFTDAFLGDYLPAHVTENQAQMMAIIRVLEYAMRTQEFIGFYSVLIRSSSKYAVSTFRKGKSSENKELVERFLELKDRLGQLKCDVALERVSPVALDNSIYRGAFRDDDETEAATC